MNLRKEIVLSLNKERKTENMYEQMLSCLDIREAQNIEKLDDWFIGSIGSLFYRPHNICLNLIGKQGIGKTRFLANLLPGWFSEISYPDMNIYNNFIVDASNTPHRAINKTISTDGFAIFQNPFRVEKRLANFAATYNTEKLKFGERHIVLYLDSIDDFKFIGLNKELLWIEIYSRFLEKHGIGKPFDNEEIENYFI